MFNRDDTYVVGTFLNKLLFVRVNNNSFFLTITGPSNIRQGASSSSREVSFPCDTSAMASSSEDASQSKALAMSVALSICQGIHGWAETSDIGQVLQKLRHLLCLVNEHGDK